MKQGDIFRTLRGTKNHVLKVLDEDDTVLIVFKWWRSGKQRWEYEVEPVWVVEQAIEICRINKKGG